MTNDTSNPPPLGLERTSLEWRHFINLVGPPSMIAEVQSIYDDSHSRLVRELILSAYAKLAKDRDDIVFARYQDILLVTYDGLSVVLRVVEIREDEPDPAEKYQLRMADGETARLMIDRYKQQLVLEENRARLRERLKHRPEVLAAVENLMYYRDMFSKGSFSLDTGKLMFVSEQDIIIDVTPLVQDSAQIGEIAMFLEDLGITVVTGHETAYIIGSYIAQRHKPNPWQLLLENKTRSLLARYPGGGFVEVNDGVIYFRQKMGSMALFVSKISCPPSAQRFIKQLSLPILDDRQFGELIQLGPNYPHNL